MPGALLYSTNPLIKLLVQERFFGDRHYVWCSESCDSSVAARYTIASLVPPTSNPKDIYQDLRRAVEKGDKHNSKIVQTRAFYIQHATDLETQGLLTAAQRDELIYMVETADMKLWRPVLYVIPRVPVEPRLQTVPPAKRASHGVEYIVSDLQRPEFDIVEL